MGYIARDKEINLLFEDSERMYRNLIETVECGIYMADNNGVLFFVNQGFVNILGYSSKEEVLGLNLAKELYVDPDERKAFLKKMEERGHVNNYIVRNRRKDGSVAHLSVTSNFIRNQQGKVLGVEGIVNDVSQNILLERKLEREKKKLEEVLGFDEKVSAIRRFDKLIDFVVQKTAKILNVNKCSLMLMDKSSMELRIRGALGISDEIIKSVCVPLGQPIAGQVAKEGEPVLVKNIDYDKRFKDQGHPSYLDRSFMIVPIRLHDKVLGVINVADKKESDEEEEKEFNEVDLKVLMDLAREVAVAIENVALYKELNYLAVIDPLTGIYNYRYFTNSLDYEIERAKRFSRDLCLMMLDLDDFKGYNDSFGHLEGDHLLKVVGHCFKGSLRQVDIVCRYAGDEFVIILPETKREGIELVAEKLRKNVEGLKLKRPVTVSIGIACFHKDMGRRELVSKADKALYDAKREGKNKICFLD